MKTLVFYLLGRCRIADWTGDDCRFWVREYAQLPCSNCKRRWSL